MAVPPQYQGHRLVLASGDLSISDIKGLHTFEIYLDYVCPFSAKAFNTFYNAVLPKLRSDPLGKKVQFIFRQQVQPWHPSSTLVHEAALAVLRLAPGRFWDFSNALFKVQTEYFDISVAGESRNQTYRRLAKLAASSAGVGEAEVYDLLRVPEKPAADGALNVGNAVTNDLKWAIKNARLVSVHVSPTVIFDGWFLDDFSSSWPADKWIEYLTANAV